MVRIEERDAVDAMAGVARRAFGGWRKASTGLLISAVLILAFASGAHAATPALVELGEFGSGAGSLGGEISRGEGVAVNRTGKGGVEAGDVYVAEASIGFGVLNNRVQEFTKDGEFVRAWGKDVLAGGGEGFEICEVAAECQAGVASGEAGALKQARGIAVDQSTGNVYVADATNRRIDVFSAKGKFEGAFGWKVDKASPEEKLQFCTTECQAGKSGAAGAGGFLSISSGALAVNPSNGNLWVGDGRTHRINEFSFTRNGSEEVTGATFVRALGWEVDKEDPKPELQECTTATGCQAGSVGSGDGELGYPLGIAVDSSGAVYVTSTSTSRGECQSVNPCRVVKFNPDGSFGEVFGPEGGGDKQCQLSWTDGVAREHNASSIALDPSSEDIFVARKRTGTSLEICTFDEEGNLLQRSPAAPLRVYSSSGSSTSHASLAVGAEEQIYLEAPNEANDSWPVKILGYVPAAPATLSPVTGFSGTCATFEGRVTVPKPGGPGYDPTYRFEYSGDNGLTWLRVPAHADATVGTTVHDTYPVEQKACGLLPNTTYRVRLVTTTSYVTTSEEETFATPVAPPSFREIRARDATGGAAAIEGRIDPNGSATRYRFEWGPTSSYGSVVPRNGEEPYIGAGQDPVLVKTRLTGLAPGTVYHYRIVASHPGGVEEPSPDQTLETLNSCGLPEGRCLELVSPKDLGPVAAPGRVENSELPAQPSTASGRLVYGVDLGLPDSNQAVTDYLGSRGSNGWGFTQLSPGVTGVIESGGYSTPTKIDALSSDLSCGVVTSTQQLTEDPIARLIIEGGGANLYRRNPDGSYTLITDLAPEGNLTATTVAGAYEVIGMSDDCSRIVFRTFVRYPGVPTIPTQSGSASQEWRLYEWDEGTIRGVGWVPNGAGGESVSEASPGLVTGTTSEIAYNVVSRNGSRVFFSAPRLTGTHPEEVGKTGVFARIDGTTTLDVSVSKTSVPDVGREYAAGNLTGAVFQGATPDGSRVYFAANAGLATESNSEGTDLYECHIVEGVDGPECKLTDISINPGGGPAEAGAAIAGLVGVAEDGSRAYFVARGQLEPEHGPTLAENKAGSTYSLYEYERAGQLGQRVHFIGTVGEREIDSVTTLFRSRSTSRTSPDGRFLLFESAADVTGYDSGGVREAYLFDAEAPASEAVSCVSCRQDGKPSINGTAPGTQPLDSPGSIPYEPNSLVVRNGRPEVFFVSRDGLAPGVNGESLEGRWALYEWAHGQVFHIAGEPSGRVGPAGTAPTLGFVGANGDATDLYFVDPAALNWENPEGRSAVWDARVGGGFPEPAAPPRGCEPTSEGSCQGPGQAAPAAPAAGTASFSGAGNVRPAGHPPRRHRKKHMHHRRKHRAKRHRKQCKKTQRQCKKKQRAARRARRANVDRRAGK